MSKVIKLTKQNFDREDLSGEFSDRLKIDKLNIGLPEHQFLAVGSDVSKKRKGD